MSAARSSSRPSGTTRRAPPGPRAERDAEAASSLVLLWRFLHMAVLRTIVVVVLTMTLALLAHAAAAQAPADRSGAALQPMPASSLGVDRERPVARRLQAPGVNTGHCSTISPPS